MENSNTKLEKLGRISFVLWVVFYVLPMVLEEVFEGVTGLFVMLGLNTLANVFLVINIYCVLKNKAVEDNRKKSYIIGLIAVCVLIFILTILQIVFVVNANTVGVIICSVIGFLLGAASKLIIKKVKVAKDNIR